MSERLDVQKPRPDKVYPLQEEEYPTRRDDEDDDEDDDDPEEVPEEDPEVIIDPAEDEDENPLDPRKGI